MYAQACNVHRSEMRIEVFVSVNLLTTHNVFAKIHKQNRRQCTTTGNLD